MTGRVVVVGGVGIDEVLYVPRVPSAGEFVQATARDERPGGAAMNVAVGIAAAGTATVLIGCIGSDPAGALLADVATQHSVDARLDVVGGLSARSVIMVEPSGERTILGATDGLLDYIRLSPDLTVSAEDCLVVPSWRPSFASLVARFREADALTIVGLRALGDPAFQGASEAVGSAYELAGSEPASHLDLVERVVVTRGLVGAISIDRDGTVTSPAEAITAVDQTGAGDAFLAGWVVGTLRNTPIAQRLRHACSCGARAAATRASLPPSPATRTPDDPR